MADLGVNIAGVHFKNPVITASGTFGFGQNMPVFMIFLRLRRYILQGDYVERTPGKSCPASL